MGDSNNRGRQGFRPPPPPPPAAEVFAEIRVTRKPDPKARKDWRPEETFRDATFKITPLGEGEAILMISSDNGKAGFACPWEDVAEMRTVAAAAPVIVTPELVVVP